MHLAGKYSLCHRTINIDLTLKWYSKFEAINACIHHKINVIRECIILGVAVTLILLTSVRAGIYVSACTLRLYERFILLI